VPERLGRPFRARKHSTELPRRERERNHPTYAIVDRKGIVRIVGLQPGHVESGVKKLLAETPAT
jgi:hypothetical protein